MDLGLDLGTTRTVVARADRANYPVLTFHDEPGDSDDQCRPSSAARRTAGLRVRGARRGPSRGAVLRSVKRSLGAPGWSPDDGPDGATTSRGRGGHGVLRAPPAAIERRRPAVRLRSAPGGPRHPAGRTAPSASSRSTPSGVPGSRSSGSSTSPRPRLRVHPPAGRARSRRSASTSSSTTSAAAPSTPRWSRWTASATRSSPVGLNRLGGDDFDAILANLVLGRPARPGDRPSRRRTAARRGARRKRGDHAADPPDHHRGARHRRGRRRVGRPDPGHRRVADFYDAATPLVGRTLDAMAPLVALLPAAESDDGEDLRRRRRLRRRRAPSLPLVPRVLRDRFGRRVHRSPLPGASTAIGSRSPRTRAAVLAERPALARLRRVPRGGRGTRWPSTRSSIATS